MKISSLIILIFFYSNNVIAQCVPFKDEHLSSSYRVSEIVVNIENIFNPSIEGENSSFHHYANKPNKNNASPTLPIWLGRPEKILYPPHKYHSLLNPLVL